MENNMKDKDIYYFDAITAININQGVVKLVLGHMDVEVGNTKEDGQASTPSHHASRIITLPLNTFIYAISVFIKDPKNMDMITKMQEAAGLNKD